MSKIYEVEVEKIRIKYEKTIGLINLNHILLNTLYFSLSIYPHDTDIFLNVLEKEGKIKILYKNLDKVLELCKFEEKPSFENTSHILRFKDVEIEMCQEGSLKSKKLTFGLVKVDNKELFITKETAEEIKYLWNSV